MKTDKKKLAAAIAAVYAHISSVEQAAMMSAAEPAASAQAVPVQPQAPVAQPNIWGMAGRQSQMQANTMMQLRVFK